LLPGSKGALKDKPKIFIAGTAIRNAVLMIDDVLADEREPGAMVETTIYLLKYTGEPMIGVNIFIVSSFCVYVIAEA